MLPHYQIWKLTPLKLTPLKLKTYQTYTLNKIQLLIQSQETYTLLVTE